MTSNSQKELIQSKQKFASMQKQYNQLLQKNQNDLINIRQKEKTMDTLIAKLEGDKQQLRQKMQHDINVLTLQIQKYKALNSNKEIPNSKTDNQKDLQSFKTQINQLSSLNKLKQDRIEQLQITSRRLIDENIQLTADKSSYKVEYQNALRQNQKYEDQIEKLKNQLKILNTEVSSTKGIQKNHQSCQTIAKFIDPSHFNELQTKLKQLQASTKQLKNLVQKNQQLKKQAQQRLHLMKQRLKQTNNQLKRLQEKQKKIVLLMKRKDQEIIKLQEQFDKMKKPSRLEKKKMETEESASCMKCKQLQQEVQILKQMVKSVNTMVRVKQIEAERYKNQANHETPKYNDSREIKNIQQIKRNQSNKFPPIRKQL